MGLFDIFKGEKKQIGTMNCLATAGRWATGYKTDTKGLVKFIKKNLKDGTLKKELEYKFVDEKVNETINKVKTPQGIFYIARNLINHKDIDVVKAFKITKEELIIFNVCNNQNYWAKKIDYDGEIISIGTDDQVIGWLSPDEVAKIITIVSSSTGVDELIQSITLMNKEYV